MDTNIHSLTELKALTDSLDGGFVSLGIIALACVLFLQRVRLPHFQPNLLSACLALAALLRLYHINDSMWYDETFTAAMVGLSLPEMFTAIQSDVHPPLYYMLLWVFAQAIGTSEIALRLPALALGILSCWLMYPLTKRLFKNHTAALTAVIVVALMPSHIRYSTEARGYMMMVVMVQAGLYAILARRRRLFLVSVALLPLAHAYGYLYAGALFGGSVVIRKMRMAAFASLVPGMLWLPFVFQQANHVSNGFWILPPSIAGAFMPIATGTLGQYGSYEIMFTSSAAFAISAFAVYETLKTIRRRTTRWAWSLLIFGVPLAAMIVGLIVAPVWLHRGLLPAVMLIVPGWALAINKYNVVKLLAMIALPVALMSYASYGWRDDLRVWIDRCDGDAIYTVSVSTAIQARYYAGGRDVYIWYHADDLAQQLPHHVQELFGLIPVYNPPEHRSLCVPVQYTPHQITAENTSHLEQILRRPHSERVHRDGITYRFTAYQVSSLGMAYE